MSDSGSSYKVAIRKAMRDILAANVNSVVLGQGVNDPTGIFGTTTGLAEEFGPDRVIDMPIMEEGMTGIGIGMALNGIFPVQTHIRVDFLMLAMNQIVNLLAKYRYMYGGQFSVPMLIRGIVGRSWGQGPQHSQSLQSLFSHIPGLTVIMPSSSRSAYESYLYSATKFRSPVLSIEHRFLYDMTFRDLDLPSKSHNPFSSRIVEKGDDVTIVATSYMVQEAQRASKWVSSYGNVRCEIIDLNCVSSINFELVLTSLKKTGRLVVADTSWREYGVSAEVCRGIAELGPECLKKPVITLGMQRSPCPTSHALEESFYADMSDIVHAVKLVTDECFPVPTKKDAKAMRQKFRGPF